MFLQSQLDYPSSPRDPSSVTFVLAGRTTLSEHSPIENVDVPYDIAERSPYLRIFLPQYASRDSPLLPIQLDDIDPAGFKLYIEWMVEESITSPTQKPLLLSSCIDLIYAHIVGAAFSIPHFQDYIIDTMARILDPTQAPDFKILEILFLEKHTSSKLKRFIIDRMFAQERRMLGMLRNDVEDMVTSMGDVKGCEYHVHEDGICYKHGRVVVDNEEVRDVKEWNVKDDAELNDMAMHYLKSACNTSPMTDKSLKSHKSSLSPQAIEYRRSMDVGHRRTRNTDVRLESCSNNIYTSDIRYHGSVARSRGPKNPNSSTLSVVPRAELDKPLPPIPPRSSSPSLPFLSTSSPTSAYEPTQMISTKSLVFECLSRLSPLPTRASTHNSETTLRAGDTTDAENEDANSLTAISIYLDNSSDEGIDIPPSLNPGSSPLTPLSREFSFMSIPKPRHTSSSPPLAHQRSDTCPQPPHSLPETMPAYSRPLIKRKPAPPRGRDWIEQWDRLHALRGTQGFGLRKTMKREKRSRFVGIFGSVRG